LAKQPVEWIGYFEVYIWEKMNQGVLEPVVIVLPLISGIGNGSVSFGAITNVDVKVFSIASIMN